MIDPQKLSSALNDPTREQRLQEDKQIPLVLLGYLTGTTSPSDAILKMEVYIQQANNTMVLPVAMSRTQCTELGAALTRLATFPYNPKAAMN